MEQEELTRQLKNHTDEILALQERRAQDHKKLQKIYDELIGDFDKKGLVDLIRDMSEDDQKVKKVIERFEKVEFIVSILKWVTGVLFLGTVGMAFNLIQKAITE